MDVKTLLTNKIGIDKAIAYSISARVVQAISGPLTILFLSMYLNGVEQGFYYTFGSIIAIQTFFELGLSGIIVQFVAHEASHLEKNSDGLLSGSHLYKSRLSSLLHFCIKWYTVISLLLFVVLVIVGHFYFNKYGAEHEDIIWKWPWVLISLSTAIKLFQSPLTAFITGLNFVKEMNLLTLIQQVVLPLVLWVSLMLGVKLYVAGISSVTAAVLWFVYICKSKLINILIDIWKTQIKEYVSYMNEIFPMQWRIALSWISGYFIFNIFNIVLFATDGPVVAGQMGMTLQVLNAIQILGSAWITTKVPVLAGFIALKNYTMLDKIFNTNLKQMLFVIIGSVLLFFGLVVFLNITQIKINSELLADRFLPYIPLLLLIVAMTVNSYVSAIAQYLRCHKKEPFLVLSIVSGMLCGLSTFVCGNLWGVWGITIGYCFITVCMSFWGHHIYVRCKQEWHSLKSI